MSIDLENILSEYTVTDTSEDFGFTGVSETEYQQQIDQVAEQVKTETEQQTVEQYKQKLLDVEALILPFLIKLMNAEETYIKWPHDVREPVIKSQIEKILQVTRS